MSENNGDDPQFPRPQGEAFKCPIYQNTKLFDIYREIKHIKAATPGKCLRTGKMTRDHSDLD